MCDDIHVSGRRYRPITVSLANTTSLTDPTGNLSARYGGAEIEFNRAGPAFQHAAGHYYFCLQNVPSDWSTAWKPRGIDMAFKLRVAMWDDPASWQILKQRNNVPENEWSHPFFATGWGIDSLNDPDSVGLLINDSPLPADKPGAHYEYLLVVGYKLAGKEDEDPSFTIVDPEIHNEGGGPVK